MKIPKISFETASVLSSEKPIRPARTKKATLNVPLAHGDASAAFGKDSPDCCIAPRREVCNHGKQNEEAKIEELFRTDGQFFSALIASGGNASLYLLNGVKLRGRLVSETESCILLKMNDSALTLANTSLIFKSAIASVVPIAFSQQARRGFRVARDIKESTTASV
jgi:sRNA-binding regulator protein Hfq